MPRDYSFSLSDFVTEFDWAAKDFEKGRGRSFEKFRQGPCLYFHRRAIALRKSRDGRRLKDWLCDDTEFCEILYAVLTAWGMNSQTARLVDFDDFRKALRHLATCSVVGELETTSLYEFRPETHEKLLSRLWSELSQHGKIMRGNSILVGSAKALHHMIPDLFPVIDRQYTLDFLRHIDDDELKLTAAQAQYAGYDAFLKAMRMFAKVASFLTRNNLSRFVSNDPKSMHTSETKVLDNALVCWWATEDTA